jgi:hypothetical protein
MQENERSAMLELLLLGTEWLVSLNNSSCTQIYLGRSNEIRDKASLQWRCNGSEASKNCKAGKLIFLNFETLSDA